MRGDERRLELPTDVVELLADDPELLAVADAIRATQPPRQRRARRLQLAAAAAIAVAVSVTVGLIVSAPAKGNRDLRRAAAAVSGAPIIRVVAATRIVGVDASGTPRRTRLRISGLYDQRGGRPRSVVHLSGVEKLRLPKLPEVETAIAQFATHYRRTLAAGDAKVTRKTPSLVWLEMTIGARRYQVALDRESYRPLLIRVTSPNAGALEIDVERFRPAA